jgi:nitroreductase
MPTTTSVYREAAEAATAAPSIFNTQPWRWQIAGSGLRLWADYSRQLIVADPQARMLAISCGAALHHARIALAAAGHKVSIARLPDPAEPDLFAEIKANGHHDPSSAERSMRQALTLRRTDRRAFLPDLVPSETAASLASAAASEGAYLHLIGKAGVAALALAAVRADALQLADPAYRRELIRWTHRPVWSGDGVPPSTAVERAPRAVPVRDFVPFDQPAQKPGPHTDHGALYAVIFTGEDNQMAWLRAGEALSAVLLTATAHGLATAPISDVTELDVTRQELGGLLSGVGVPQMALRIGYPPGGLAPRAPRRPPAEVIYP